MYIYKNRVSERLTDNSLEIYTNVMGRLPSIISASPGDMISGVGYPVNIEIN
jgi:hypothetical protein